MRRYLRLLVYLRPHTRAAAAVLATMLLSSAVGLLEPWPLKLLVDNVIGTHAAPGWITTGADALPGPDGRRGLLLAVVVGGVVVFVVKALLETYNSLAATVVSQRMTYRLGADVFRHLQRLSLVYHQRHPAGDALARVTGDTSCVSILVVDALLPALQAAVTVVTMFVIMWRLEPTLTVLALGVAPLLVLSIRVLGGPMKRRNRRRRDLEAAMMSAVERTLAVLPVVQAFTREDLEDARFRRAADETLEAYRRSVAVDMAFKLLVGLATAAGTATIVYVGGTYVLDGRMTIGTVLVFLAYLAALYGPLEGLTYTGSTLQYALAQADRVLELLETSPEVEDAPDALDVTLAGRIRYEDVDFAYEPGRPVLRGVSFEASPGEVLAIVGPSGAGKTTLVNLLVRFLDPGSGRITIDGFDLRALRLRTLREQVGLVLQDPFVQPLTVAENIAVGRPGASRAAIVAAAVDANADGFISRLPQGYDTVVGERGGTLSGGEKQRLAIARAFLKDAPILVLDEPTSALDARTETQLLDALERLMAGRVSLIIAHRLSTIRQADRIIVLDGGQIVEQGSHDELVRGGGLYAGLYRQQMDLARHAANGAEATARPVVR